MVVKVATKPAAVGRAYGEDDIAVVRNLMAVRAKVNYYIGPTDDYGRYTIAREPLDNVIDEMAAGRATELTCRLWRNGRVEIHDNGQGMPVGIHRTEKISTLQVIVSQLHGGGKLKAGTAYTKTRGTHGIGLKATNALSDYFRVYTYRDAEWHTIAYEQGVLTDPVRTATGREIGRECALVYRHGTVILFDPDVTMFDQGARIVPDMVLEWAKISSYLTAGAKITVEVEGRKPQVFQAQAGMTQWLDEQLTALDAGSLAKAPIEYRSEDLDVILTFTDADGPRLQAYCNGLHQSEGGNHLVGVQQALFTSLKPYFTVTQAKAQKDGGLTRDDILDGVLGLINFQVDAPRFSSQDKIKLTDPRFDEFCAKPLAEFLAAYWTKNKGLAATVCKRAQDLRGMKSKFAMNKAAIRDLKDHRNQMGRLPTKLATANCSDAEREVFLVEGDSAGGHADGARMSKPKRFQETLALKGKPLNAYKTNNDKLLQSDEIKNILVAIGYDPEAKDPISKLRVSKIILLSDPDPDGKHINCLVLGLFAKLIPGVFAREMVYTVVSPKYLLSDRDTQYFGLTLDELRGKLPRGVDIARASYLKGWGEIDDVNSLRTVAFDPGSRQLQKIKAPTAKEISGFERLMGDDPETRRLLLGIA